MGLKGNSYRKATRSLAKRAAVTKDKRFFLKNKSHEAAAPPTQGESIFILIVS
jgi:hypothetical protein